MSRYDSKKNDYDLYTEQIINESDKGNTKNKRVRIVILFAIIAAAVLFCVFVLPGMIRWADRKINAGYSEITLNSGEAAPDEEINMLVESGTGDGDPVEAYKEALNAMQGRVSDIKRSVVTVTAKNDSITDFFNGDPKTDSKPGLVIGKTKTRLVILTSADAVDEERPVIIKTDDDNLIQGTYLSENASTGLALVSVKTADFTEKGVSLPDVITIGNSDSVSPGAGVIAYGCLKGNAGSADFGMVSGVGDADVADFRYSTINTAITASDGDFGFLFNSRGSLIGVSVPEDDPGTFNALGIDSLKKLIETMSNGKQVPYMGILGKEITDELAKEYDIPKGLYVNSVAMDSPAFKAGIQAGDIIVSVSSKDILTLDNFSDCLYNCSAGQTVKTVIRRQGNNEYRTINFNVTLTDGRKE